MEVLRAPEVEPDRLRGTAPVETEARQALEEGTNGHCALEPRQVDPGTHVLALAARQVLPGVGSPDQKNVGIGEGRRVPVRGVDDRDQIVACRDRDPGELGVFNRPAIGVANRRNPAQSLLYCIGPEIRFRQHERQLVGVVQEGPGRIEDHRLDRLDRAEEDHPQVREQLLLVTAVLLVGVEDRRQVDPPGQPRYRSRFGSTIDHLVAAPDGR